MISLSWLDSVWSMRSIARSIVRGQVAVEGDGTAERLLDQRPDQVLGTIRLGLLGGGDDLVEQARRVSVVAPVRCLRRLAIGHGSAPPCRGRVRRSRSASRSVLFLQDRLEQPFQLLGAVDLAHQVAQPVAGLQQRLQRRDLLEHARPARNPRCR